MKQIDEHTFEFEEEDFQLVDALMAKRAEGGTSRMQEYTDKYFIASGWDAQLRKCIVGKRGHQGLITLRDALVAMPEKRLERQVYVSAGSVCALGALAVYERTKTHDLSWDLAAEVVERESAESIDPLNMYSYATAVGIARTLAGEIVHINDNYIDGEEPEARWQRIHAWVVRAIAVGERGETGTVR